MTEPQLQEFVRKAEAIYFGRLRTILEPDHADQYVAIEPDSGNYFLGNTLNEASRAAREAYPHRLTHAMRVGHKAALHFGMQIR